MQCISEWINPLPLVPSRTSVSPRLAPSSASSFASSPRSVAAVPAPAAPELLAPLPRDLQPCDVVTLAHLRHVLLAIDDCLVADSVLRLLARFLPHAEVQQVRDRVALQGSLAMLVAQFASLAGACVAGWLIRRVGLRGSGAFLLALYSAAMFASCIVTSTSPLWILIGILSVAAVAEIGSGVCLSQAIMSCAPKDGERAVSSYRSAATGIGNALALLLVASSVSHAMGESMREEAVLRNTPADKVHVLVQAVRDNVPTSVIGRELDLSEERVQELRVARLEVIVDGFRAHGLVSGSVLAVAAAGFWLVRRDERPRAAAD